MAVTRKGSAWEFKKSLWVIWSFIFLLNGVGMHHMGKKVKVKKWRNYGLIYTAATWIGMIVGSEFKGSILEDIGVAMFLIAWIGGIIHCFKIRKEYLMRLELLEEQKVEQKETDNLRSQIAREYGINNIEENMTSRINNMEENMTSRINIEHSDLVKEQSNKVEKENMISSQYKGSSTPPVIPEVEVNNESVELKERTMLDINTCSELELSELPGMGIILAKKAVNLRSSRAGFSSVDEFIQELGVKAHYIERLKMRICCTEVKAVESIKTTGRMVDF